MVPTAHLKAFEPLDAFEDGEREYWRRYVAGGERPAAQRAVILSRDVGLAPTIATAIAEREHADVIVRHGKAFVCPHRTRLRLLAAVVAFRQTIPDEAAPAFLPEEQFDDALAELERLHGEHPEWRNHILESPWEVPLRWFVLFDEAERRVSTARGLTTLRYDTTAIMASERLRGALEVLREQLPASTVVGLVADLARWVEQFHDQALIVLEYGAVGRLFPQTELRSDRTARDIWQAIHALERGDPDTAAAAYSAAAERWARVRSRESVN